MDLSGRQVLISDRTFMTTDDFVAVKSDEAVADGPLVELSADERRRDRELRPARADIHREPNRVEDGVDGITRQSDDEESKRPDTMLTANVNRVDEIRSQDGFAVDALLYLRVRTLHAKVDARTAGLRHNGDCRLLKAVDAGFARPLHAEPAPQDLLADCDDPF